MKNYEETIDSVLGRVHAYEADQKRKRRERKRVAVVFSCFCLVALMGIGAWKVASPSVEEVSREFPSSDWGGMNPSILWNKEWNGKRIGYNLNKAIEQSEEDERLFICVSCSWDSWDEQFVYEGKTLAEYRAERDDEWELDRKLAQLLKEGEVLQYGEAVYQTGTPEGERWAKELYEDTVAYYGKEFLETYIVNGVFLREKAEGDYAVCMEHKTQEAYETACNAYVDQRLEEAEKQLKKQKIRYEVRAGSGYESYGYVVMDVSVKEFASLSLDPLSDWYFDLYGDLLAPA